MTNLNAEKSLCRRGLQIVRPRQWTKNVFVFAPLVFAGLLHDIGAIGRAVAMFAIFCLAASTVYIWNDLCDEQDDRRNPRNLRTRPLASGDLLRSQAITILVILEAILVFGLWLLPRAMAAVLTYQLVNVVYSIWLKNFAVLDIFCVASGFLLRVFGGAAALDVPLSSWMLTTTLCLALYLAATKRRQELASNGADARQVLKNYSIDLLDRYADFAAICSVVFYGMFVMTVRPKLENTLPIVIFGFFRYRYLVEKKGIGESPSDVVWVDFPLAAAVLLWIGICTWTMF